MRVIRGREADTPSDSAPAESDVPKASETDDETVKEEEE